MQPQCGLCQRWAAKLIAFLHDVVRALPRNRVVQVLTSPIVYISATAMPPDAITTGKGAGMLGTALDPTHFLTMYERGLQYSL